MKTLVQKEIRLLLPAFARGLAPALQLPVSVPAHRTPPPGGPARLTLVFDHAVALSHFDASLA